MADTITTNDELRTTILANSKGKCGNARGMPALCLCIYSLIIFHIPSAYITKEIRNVAKIITGNMNAIARVKLPSGFFLIASWSPLLGYSIFGMKTHPIKTFYCED